MQDGGLLHAAQHLVARARTLVDSCLDEMHSDPDSVPEETLAYALARIEKDLTESRTHVVGLLLAARTVVGQGPSPAHAVAAECTAPTFAPIRHTGTGEITTTGYNAAGRRILLQSGFEETPGSVCPATDTGT